MRSCTKCCGGGAEDVNNGQQTYGQPQPPYQQQVYQQQTSYEQQGQYGQPYEASQQSQPYMQQQTLYGNATQQWQQPQYGQPQPQYGQQFNQGYAQKNTQNPIRKKSRAPLIIGIVAALLIIAGIAVGTVLILLNNSKTGTGGAGTAEDAAEDVVEMFLEALIDKDYSKAAGYVLPGLDNSKIGGIDLSESSLRKKFKDKSIRRYTIDYDELIIEEQDIKALNKALDYYDEEITDAIGVEICLEFGDSEEYCDIAVVKISDGWWIAAYAEVYY